MITTFFLFVTTMCEMFPLHIALQHSYHLHINLCRNPNSSPKCLHSSIQNRHMYYCHHDTSLGVPGFCPVSYWTAQGNSQFSPKVEAKNNVLSSGKFHLQPALPLGMEHQQYLHKNSTGNCRRDERTLPACLFILWWSDNQPHSPWSSHREHISWQSSILPNPERMETETKTAAPQTPLVQWPTVAHFYFVVTIQTQFRDSMISYFLYGQEQMTHQDSGATHPTHQKQHTNWCTNVQHPPPGSHSSDTWIVNAKKNIK